MGYHAVFRGLPALSSDRYIALRSRSGLERLNGPSAGSLLDQHYDRKSKTMKLTAILVTALAAVATATISAPSASAQERETYESGTLGPIFQNLLRMVPAEGIIITAPDGWDA